MELRDAIAQLKEKEWSFHSFEDDGCFISIEFGVPYGNVRIGYSKFNDEPWVEFGSGDRDDPIYLDVSTFQLFSEVFNRVKSDYDIYTIARLAKEI